MTITINELVKIAEENDQGQPPKPGAEVVLIRHEWGGIELYNKGSLFPLGSPLLESVTLDTPGGTKITLEHLASTSAFWDLLQKTPPIGNPFCLTVMHNFSHGMYRYAIRCNPHSYEITKSKETGGENIIRMILIVVQSAGALVGVDDPKHPLSSHGPVHKGSSKIEGQEQEAFVKKILHSKYLEEAVDSNAAVVKPVPKGKLEPAKPAKPKAHTLYPIGDVKGYSVPAKQGLTDEMIEKLAEAKVTGQTMAFEFFDEIAKISAEHKQKIGGMTPDEYLKEITKVQSLQADLKAKQEKTMADTLKELLAKVGIVGEPPSPEKEETEETKPEPPKGRKVILD